MNADGRIQTNTQWKAMGMPCPDVTGTGDQVDAKALYEMGCRLVRQRRFAKAHRVLSQSAKQGSIRAGELMKTLGWPDLAATPDNVNTAPPPDCFLPSTIAFERLSDQRSCLVPDFLTGFTGGRGGNLTIMEAEPDGCSPDELKAMSRYLTSLWEALIPVMAERLDAVHGSAFGREFWRRALGMGFHRHLALVYDHFRITAKAMEHSDIRASTLDSSCYYVPADYDDLHWFLSDDAFGQEQLFSLYCRCFHPQRYPDYRQHYQSDYVLAPVVTPPTGHQPVVGILGSWFSEHWHKTLVRASGRNIERIGYDRRFSFDRSTDGEKRAFLSRPESRLDGFANFFLSTLASLMPRIFVEDWHPVYRCLHAQMSLYRRMKYVVSELWIGDAVEPIVMAILMQRGVKLIFHEHNYAEHPYVGSAVHNWARLCDVYLAHGPHGKELPNGIDGGSLYAFGDARKPQSNFAHDILYVSGLTFLRDSLASGSSAVQGYAAWAGPSMNFKRSFLTALKKEIRAKFHYRGYPRDGYGQNWNNCHDDMRFLGDLLADATVDDHRRSGRQVMRASRLVVVSYIATSHLESLTMNIPTILLFTVSRKYLSLKFKDFFKPLIDAGICQHDPLQAAAFVERVYEDPQKWWTAPEVQQARKVFLTSAVGQPEKAAHFLLDLAAGAGICRDDGRMS